MWVHMRHGSMRRPQDNLQEDCPVGFRELSPAYQAAVLPAPKAPFLKLSKLCREYHFVLMT